MSGSMLGLFNKRNVFDMSHERKFSCDMGNLVPIMCEEVVPGDTFKVKTELLLRISPLLAPVMHRVNVFTHYFFVPNRLIWDDWQTFITGGRDGTDSTTIPYVYTTPTAKSLADYFGLPIGNLLAVSVLPFRAYALIYNEWFRDQNLQTELVVSKDNAQDITTSMILMNRNWEKDYFTSCLPWPQRGPAVTIGVGTTAPVAITGSASVSQTQRYNPVGVLYPGGPEGDFKVTDWDNPTGTSSGPIHATGGITNPDPYHGKPIDANEAARTLSGPISATGTADLTSAGAVTINALRQAFQIQKWMERNARAGVRYVESILSHFGVRSSDARLQRPEFLGGGRSPVVISEVLQTSSSDVTSPQGNMAGHGYSALQSNQFTKSFEEHGFIIGLISILPRTAYQQGVSRMWSRGTRYDYYWPEFAHLGEQAVLQKEIHATGLVSHDDGVFGYQGRYDEYRRRESTVHGDFKTSLDFWHMGRIFATDPILNGQFVTADPTKRINAVPTENNCWVQLVNNVEAIRPIPKVGEPGLIDHN